jgi:hypothetical protein
MCPPPDGTAHPDSEPGARRADTDGEPSPNEARDNGPRARVADLRKERLVSDVPVRKPGFITFGIDASRT